MWSENRLLSSSAQTAGALAVYDHVHCQQDTLFSQPQFDAGVNVDQVLNQANMPGMQTSQFIQLAVLTNTQKACSIASYLLWLCVHDRVF